jgi:hypothetical protein
MSEIGCAAYPAQNQLARPIPGGNRPEHSIRGECPEQFAPGTEPDSFEPTCCPFCGAGELKQTQMGTLLIVFGTLDAEAMTGGILGVRTKFEWGHSLLS